MLVLEVLGLVSDSPSKHYSKRSRMLNALGAEGPMGLASTGYFMQYGIRSNISKL